MGRKLDHRAVYEIRVIGRLDQTWSDWFDGFTITQHNDETLLVGRVADQSALLGLLAKICQLNLAIISLNRLGTKTNRPQD